MKKTKRLFVASAGFWLAGFMLLFVVSGLFGQQSSAPEQKAWTTAEDHQNMMQQLGIKKLRPGPSGREGQPNQANYDEATANPFPNLPEVLKLKNGKKVTNAKTWRKQRRPEIVEDFEREVLGRIPKNVPKVTWTVTNQTEAKIGAYPVIGKQLVGHVDNSSYPAINVDIQMILVTPADAKGPVPVMIMFGYGSPAWRPATARACGTRIRTSARRQRSACDRPADRGWLGVRIFESQ